MVTPGSKLKAAFYSQKAARAKTALDKQRNIASVFVHTTNLISLVTSGIQDDIAAGDCSGSSPRGIRHSISGLHETTGWTEPGALPGTLLHSEGPAGESRVWRTYLRDATNSVPDEYCPHCFGMW